MRALDCVHPAHEDMHFAAESDDALLDQVKSHRDEFHPEMTDDQLSEYLSANAYDE